jgi:tRNA dimethylallyltransferase
VSVVEQALRFAQESGHLLAIVGPTASGKTSLAVALAEKLGGEVVSADSVQIYRGFDAGSGKPSADELARAPHHLVSAIDPRDPIDAAAWAELALDRIAEIRARGRVPVVCGGTFLWVKVLRFGLAGAPPASEAIRGRHRTIAEAEGRAALHVQLAAVDPEAAAKLHPNDFVRVSRALEVFEQSGKTLTAWQREHAFARVRHPARLLALAHDQATLTRRIQSRVAAWLSHGWIEEVESLVARGYGASRAMGSVGYSQVNAMLKGELARSDLEETIVRATRVFARRQRTWLREADVVWLSGEIRATERDL